MTTTPLTVDAASSTLTPPVHLELIGVTKTFAGTTAVDDVSIAFERGRIHALVGENGAGKSTVGKIIAGVVSPDQGQIRVNGTHVTYRSPRAGLGHGIALVHQEISLVPTMSVIDNVMLGVEGGTLGIPSRRRLATLFNDLNKQTGFHLEPSTTVDQLTLAEQQKVEIMRAMARNAQLIVFDEPTAALGAKETAQLHAILRELKDSGRTIILVSHFLDEVLDLADTITVLRDAQLVRTSPAAEETVSTLIEAMLGRSLEATFPDKSATTGSECAMELRSLGRAGLVEPTSFTVHRGEIVCLAGLVGSGRTELMRLVFGADKATSGTTTVRGVEVRSGSIRAAMKAGIAYLPENRRDDGILSMLSVAHNISISSLDRLATRGWTRVRQEREWIDDITRRADIRMRDPNMPIGQLSGGNQQKALLARWLMRDPGVLIIDEPTRGVDIGARRAMYDLIRTAAATGVAVIVISSDTDEVRGLADRILVMRSGAVVAELPGDASEQDVLSAAFADASQESRTS